jgi:hypothetical protein
MPTQTSPDHPQYSASVQRNVPGIHDRDPLLIPRLFKDALPPWYRRRSGQVLAALLVLCVLAVALVVFRFGVKGTAELMGRFGLALLRGFAHIADR